MCCSNPTVHERAIGVVCNLLYCHDLDPRFNDSQMRSKIAQLYLPLINIACDVHDQLWDPSSTSRTSTTNKTADGIDLSIARAISTSSVVGARNIGVELALKVCLSAVSLTPLIYHRIPSGMKRQLLTIGSVVEELPKL